MAELNPVLTALEKVASKRSGSFAIVTADAGKNYYAQFAAGEKHGLYAEVVGNDYLAPTDRLTQAKQDTMRSRGWSGNGRESWSREWPDASTTEIRHQIALELLETLREVYGATSQLQVEVTLESADRDSEVVSQNGKRTKWADLSIRTKLLVYLLIINPVVALFAFEAKTGICLSQRGYRCPVPPAEPQTWSEVLGSLPHIVLRAAGAILMGALLIEGITWLIRAFKEEFASSR